MNFTLPNGWYDFLKWFGLIALPAIATFIGAVGPEWGWSHTEAIVSTLNQLGTLLGALICVSTISYNKTQK